MSDEAKDELGGEGSRDLVGDVERANAAAAKGPLAALLTPAATVFGNRLEEWAERVAGKRRDNIQAHVDAVKAKNPDAKLQDNPRQQDDLLQWSEFASRIPKEDDELACLWQGLLEEILKGSNDNTKIIEICREMNQQDLQTLQHISNDKKIMKR